MLLGQSLPSGDVTGILTKKNAEKVFLFLNLLFQSGDFRARRENQLLFIANHPRHREVCETITGEEKTDMLRFCAVLAIILACNNAPCQQSGDKVEAPSCCYSELYRKEGWVIPGIKGAKTKGRAVVLEKHGVYMTELDPTTHKATIQSFSCSREHAGRVEIEDRDVEIISLTSFDVGGRIFAYNLVYGIDGIGAEWTVRFYDLNGSGRFTLRRSERNRIVPELLPDWVTASAKAPQGF